jgi:hypothetical protein
MALVEEWVPQEPTDGLKRWDRHGVVWTPRDGVWWGDLGHTGEDGEPVEQYRQWHELSGRGPFEVASSASRP